MNYWVIGSLNVDLVVTVDRFHGPGETILGDTFGTYLGGKGGNQCMALARLGTAPAMVGRVGDDQFGRRYRDALKDAGARVDLLETDPNEPTGTALIEVERSGDNRIVVVPGANGTVTPARVSNALDKVGAGDIVLLQLEIPMETVVSVADRARRQGAVVILDPAPAAPLPPELLRNVTWLTPNEHEAAVLTDIDTATDDGLRRAALALSRYGIEHIVIKAGERGAWYLPSDAEEPILVPSFSVQAVDTTAAGDSFNAGLAWALGGDGSAVTEGGAVTTSAGNTSTPSTDSIAVDAVRHASAVAAISVTGEGAQSAMPTANEVAAFLSGR
jgi:ribokinase